MAWTRSPRLRGVLLGLWYLGWVAGGILLIRAATPWGIGIRVDSLFYLTSAQNLAADRCLCLIGSGQVLRPLTHFGPLYPLLLWAGTSLTGNLLGTAREITAVLYGVNLALWGALVHRQTGRFWAGAIVTILLAGSATILQVHDAAMSEPLFLVILALEVSVLTDYLVTGKRRSLWLAAAAVATAVLTRYAAGWMIVLGMAAMLLLQRSHWKARLGDAVCFGVGASLPVALWFARNLVTAGTATNRMLRWHPISVDDVRTFLRLVTAWFTSNKYSHWLEGAVLLGVLVGIAIFLRSSRWAGTESPDRASILGLVLVGVAATYPVYIAISKSLFDDSIPVDDRMFAPLFVSLAALMGVVAAVVSRMRRSRWVLLPLALILIAVLPYGAGRAREKFESMRRDGVRFASREWRESEAIAWLKGLPPEARVYSNLGMLAQFLAARPVFEFPERVDPVEGDDQDEYETQLAQMRQDLGQPQTFLLVIYGGTPVTPDDLPEEFREGLRLVKVLEDGFVMAIPSSESVP